MMRLRSMKAPLVALLAAGCTMLPGGRDSGYEHRFRLSATEAARCFARNAEAHSSALSSEISAGQRGSFLVVVRVKNGAPYASARIEPAERGATGLVDLNVQSSQGNRQLLEELVRGC